MEASWAPGAQDAFKNSRRTPQELLKMAPGGPKTPQKGAKRVPRDPPKGPRGHPNNPKTTFKLKLRKTSKMTTLSMKINDFGGPQPFKMNPNQAQKTKK